MIDVTGRKIVSGDIVEISGAYFKRHNGYWVVQNSPGDENWTGSDHSLIKVSKRGKISYAKSNLCFWPLVHFVSNRKLADEAKEHDKKYAIIRVIGHADIQGANFEKSSPERTEYVNW
jgi:hypothetical protein